MFWIVFWCFQCKNNFFYGTVQYGQLMFFLICKPLSVVAILEKILNGDEIAGQIYRLSLHACI